MPLIIPDPSQPDNNIDVYLRPLIEELKDLWGHGLDIYDASKNETFRMHAALLWTINDFPAYAVLSGWSKKGRLACLCCLRDMHNIRLKMEGNASICDIVDIQITGTDGDVKPTNLMELLKPEML